MSVVYDGSQPYIFISYSHKDTPIVHQIIDDLRNKGFRVWYDNGIEAGSEWPEFIAAHLRNASCLISFISDNFAESDNCRRELVFSQELNKPMLCVYIAQTTLPDGLRMQLVLNQALYREKYSTHDSFLNALTAAELIQPCRELPPKEEPPLTPPPVTIQDETLSAEESVESHKEDTEDSAAYQESKKRYAKMTRSHVLLELLSLPLSLSAVNYVTSYITTWWLAALLIAIPHILIVTVIVSRIRRFQENTEFHHEPSFGFEATWFFITVLTLILSYFYIHYPLGVLMKILSALGLNLLPAIVTFILLCFVV